MGYQHSYLHSICTAICTAIFTGAAALSEILARATAGWLTTGRETPCRRVS